MDIINSNSIENAQSIIDSLGANNVKRIKADRGLIEREKMNDDKIILTEDNRQILLG